MKKESALKLVEGGRGAAALLDPLRLEIVRCLREPDSASGIARRLRLPRQKVNYHLRELEKHGFIEHVEDRRKGNCVERIVRATATSYLINPAALGALAADPDRIQDRFSSAYLVAVASRTIQEVADLRAQAEKQNKKLATLTVQADIRFASAASRQAFAEELSNAIARLVSKYHDDKAAGGRAFRLVSAVYPAATRKKK